MADGRVVAVLLFIVAIVVMAIILIATSLEKLDNKEVGLQYDTVQKELGDKTFTEGLHLGPVGYEFIIFPNIYSTMTYGNIKCLNKDGLRITLAVSYQYRIQIPYMKDVVMQFKDWDGYEKILTRVGVAVAYETCSEFNTTEFQTERSRFEKAMSDLMSIRYGDLHAEVAGLQVNNIERPWEYERAIKEKERAREDIEVAKKERPRQETEARTKLREAESEADIILNKANSEARILNQLAQAEAEAIKEQYAKEAEAYESIMGSNGLGFTPEGFISYLGVRVIADAKNPVHIGLNSPAKSSYVKS